MTLREQLLYYISAGEIPTDPIRIMKGLFLFTQAVNEGKLSGQEETFSFSAMSYGPCAPAVYGELQTLVHAGHVREEAVPGQSWSRYSATTNGRREARTIELKTPNEITSFLRELRAWCDAHSFSSLLKAVYEAYPDFAVNSVFKK